MTCTPSTRCLLDSVAHRLIFAQVVLVVTFPWTLALVVSSGYVAAALFAVGHFLLLGYVQRQRGNHMTRLLD